MRRPDLPFLRNLLWANLAAFLAAVAILAVAWAIDTRPDDEVRRGVRVAGVDVGGMPLDELAEALVSIASDQRSTPVALVLDGASGEVVSTTDADSLGLRVDETATATAALAVGRHRALPLRPFDWLGSIIGSATDVPVRFDLDADQARRTIGAIDETGRTDPVEPSIRLVDGRLQPVAGVDGFGIDSDAALPSILQAAMEASTHRSGSDPAAIRVEVETTKVSPLFDLEDAGELASRANRLTRDAITIEAEGLEATIEPEVLASWATAEVVTTDDGPELQLAFDRERITTDVSERLADIETAPVNARFTVENFGSDTDERVVVTPGEPGRSCCAADVADVVLRAVENPERDRAVPIPFRSVDPDITLSNADELGVVERIGSFTTTHAAGQSRVTNIHRIADLTRGALIEPGGTFSVNGFIGRRTRANGFVAAGVIYDGVFTDDVGGGISQYATTLFNAAFFGGLEIPVYQSHSIYISRYPRGREATLSFPNPDLKIHNPTPYGVLIWPTYTSTSITITLFSTKWAVGEQVGQSSRRQGNCTRVTTTRERTFLDDGHTERDTVFALYRPAEGVNC